MTRLSRKVSGTSKTRFNEKHESMLINVTTFATTPDNLPVTNSVPAFGTSIMNIQSNLTTIRTLRGLSMISLTGYAEQKEEIKTALSNVLGNGMQAVYTYARVSNNAVLANQMDVAPSTLFKMSYPSLLAFAGTVIGIVSPLASAGTLTTYNVTSASVSAWQAVVDQLTAAFSGPKNAIANRVALKDAMYGLLRDCMVTLTNESDTLVRQITNANYLSAYYSNRKLDNNTIHTKLRLFVIDRFSSPVTSGEAFVVGTPLTASLDSKGFLRIDMIPFGQHRVYLTTEQGNLDLGFIDFKKGKSVTLHVQVGVENSTGVTVKKTEETISETEDASAEK